ncbi:MAG: chemotaxis protein CheV [Pseudomonadota bacterium]
MASILDDVDRRTQMVGQNRLELLLFSLDGKQRFGINVFKVREVIQCPPLAHLPKSHPAIRGVATIRGKTIPVIDLSMAIGNSPMMEVSGGYVIVTEYNRSVQGLLVNGMDRIVNTKWESVLPPPKGAGNNSYLTAVTKLDDHLVEILDVEKVFAEVIHYSVEVSAEVADIGPASEEAAAPHVLVVDDSSVARGQIKRTLDQIKVSYTLASDGREALKVLKQWAEANDPLLARLSMVISDIEMPEMDGYTLTSEIRKDPRLQDLYVILHSSLSGVFNDAMVKKVGASKFIAKFSADDLAMAVLNRLKWLEDNKRK